VIAVEPSDVMAAQRPASLAPALRATAASLPLRDGSVDAAMAVLSIHHWDDEREQGVRELRRVARGPVVLLTYDPRVSGAMWLCARYVPEIAALDHEIFPVPELLAQWLGGRVAIETVPIVRDSQDWMLGALWAHPERVLDPDARAVTSGFARMPDHVVARAVEALRVDLANGHWDSQHGYLRNLEEHDVGLRLIVALP
jgi:SAM-dependent methyltransferase